MLAWHEGIGRLPVASWIPDTELYKADKQGYQGLLAQTTAVSSLPHAFHNVALMADAHSGFGMPIGGVLALKGALCPSAVGYDIGCGMLAFSCPDVDPEEFLVIRHQIGEAVLKAIPCGEGKDTGMGDRSLENKFGAYPFPGFKQANQKAESKWFNQLNTLGGGNHFIEFGIDENGMLWVVIHSGSRGVGHAVAGGYMKAAQEYCAIMSSEFGQIPKDLACLPVDSDPGQAYMHDLKTCLDWALKNRECMALSVKNVLFSLLQARTFGEIINVHHNDANLETHFGEDVWVHRKGATRAFTGDTLVIPGNMGQGTAICSGLGQLESFKSSSHGAGRALGRAEAKRILDPAKCIAELEELDVVLMTPSGRLEDAIDEMPASYKNFTDVLERQSDCVHVDALIKPKLVIKG